MGRGAEGGVGAGWVEENRFRLRLKILYKNLWVSIVDVAAMEFGFIDFFWVFEAEATLQIQKK